MPFRVSFFSQQQSSKVGGWSENFWNSGSDLSVLIGAPATQLNPAGIVGSINPLRTALDYIKGAQVYIPNVRVSDVANFRQVALVEFADAAPHAVTPSVNQDADYPNTALLIALVGANGARVKQWVRGIPDTIVANSGRFNPSGWGPFQQYLNRFFAVLTNPTNLWSLNVRDPSKKPQPVQAFNYTTGVVSANNHGITPIGSTQEIRLKGFGKGNPANRVWQCLVTDSNTLTITPWAIPTPTPIITGKKPKVQWQLYIMTPIASGSVVRVSSHKTGRPIGQLSGRRRGR